MYLFYYWIKGAHLKARLWNLMAFNEWPQLRRCNSSECPNLYWEFSPVVGLELWDSFQTQTCFAGLLIYIIQWRIIMKRWGTRSNLNFCLIMRQGVIFHQILCCGRVPTLIHDKLDNKTIWWSNELVDSILPFIWHYFWVFKFKS